MGRMLEVLRQDRPPGRLAEAAHATNSGWSAANDKVTPTVAEAAEIPFIEVGAHQWMEASPEVLASAGAAPRAETSVRAMPAGETKSVSLAASPRRVELRRAEPKRVSLREFRVERPPTRFANELVALHAPEHPVSEQYRELVEAMTGRRDTAKVILFTAGRGEAGTTTALLNLAASAAHLERHVIVVDANLRRPGIAERLGLAEAPGIRELLASSSSLEQAIRATAVPNLHAIAAGVKPAVVSPRLGADPARMMLARLRDRFDLVFVDGPSWDGSPEIVALGLACDAVYLVLPEAEAEAQEAAALCQLIHEQGARLAGCILSRY